jgi:hypothetical protein
MDKFAKILSQDLYSVNDSRNLSFRIISEYDTDVSLEVKIKVNNHAKSAFFKEKQGKALWNLV